MAKPLPLLSTESVCKRAGAFIFLLALFILTGFVKTAKAQTIVINNQYVDGNGQSHKSDYALYIHVSGINAITKNASSLLVSNSAADQRIGNFLVNYFDNDQSDSISVQIPVFLGPNSQRSFYVDFSYSTNDAKPITKNVTATLSGTTAALNAPANLTVKDQEPFGSTESFIDLTWAKGTSVPDSDVKYVIYRNNVAIDSVPGNQTLYSNFNAPANVFCKYTVKTKLSDIGVKAFGLSGPVSSVLSNTVTAYHYVKSFTASQGLQGKVLLTWADGSDYFTKIRIYRDDQQLAVADPSATTYTDVDVAPGVRYTYKVLFTDLAGDTTSAKAVGFKAPIGKIFGHILTKQGSAVDSVQVMAKTVVDGVTYTYKAQTDVSGYYELDSLYFGKTSSVFSIKPKFKDHVFGPDSLTRSLDINLSTAASVDFTDNTAYTIAGVVRFNPTPDITPGTTKNYLPVSGAQMILNGKNTGITTDASGNYSLTVNDIGKYTVQPVLYQHKIFVDNGSAKIVDTVQVNSSLANVNFLDMQTDTLVIKVIGGCQQPIGDHATVTLSSAGNEVSVGETIYADSVTFNKGIFDLKGNPAISNGVIKLVLPATIFKIIPGEVFETKNSSNAKKKNYLSVNYPLITVDLTKRDTTTTTDTIKNKDGTTAIDTIRTIPVHSAIFAYHQDIKIAGDFSAIQTHQLKINGASSGTNTYFMNQHEIEPVPIHVMEVYDYKKTRYTAKLDSAKVHIVDAVSDAGNNLNYNAKADTSKAPYDTLSYKIIAGAPNITAPYLKSFELQAQATIDGVLHNADTTASMVVLGQRPRNGTFITTTPEIPFEILHDPPGSASYASITKGKSSSKSVSVSYEEVGGAGLYLNMKLGEGSDSPFVGDVGGGVEVETSVEADAGGVQTKGAQVTTTYTEGFSTSSDPQFIGNDGDVYIGGSINMLLAKTDTLGYNTNTMKIDTGTSIAFNFNGFNTTYEYTEYHIKNVIIPQLQTLLTQATTNYNTAANKTNHDNYFNQMLRYQSSLDAWKNAVANNAKHRMKDTTTSGIFQYDNKLGKNISFGAGSSYNNSVTVDSTSTNSQVIEVFVSADAKVGAFAKVGDFNDGETGVLINFKFNYTNTKTTTTDNSVTTSYHLEDDNPGNYFSVNVSTDSLYGTPIFNVVSGASSCPHEPNTQYRALPSIAIADGTVSRQDNVPVDQAAKFQIQISNLSESEETQQYSIQVDPTSNLYGATVTVGGQDATKGAALFNLPYNKLFTLPVAVTKGPLSNDYAGLRLVMYPTCEASYIDVFNTDTITDSIDIDAHFQSSCSTVDLLNPCPNWLVNQSNNNILNITFSSYDISQSSPLTDLVFQYTKAGANNWINVVDLKKAAITPGYDDYAWDVPGLDDGPYQLRAYAACALQNGITYSPIYSGVIDRKSAVAYGVPSPQNGILTTADNISVTFNKAIACDDKQSPVSVLLKRADNGQVIPASYTCSGTGIQLNVNADTLNSLENVGLIASVMNVKDQSGNLIKDTLSWRFVVSRSNVYWSPANVTLNTTAGVDTAFSAALGNRTATTQNFTLTKYPSWLTPGVTAQSIPSQGSYPLSFGVSSNLNPGEYKDTVTATVNNKAIYFYVDLNVLRKAPKWSVNPADYKYSMNIVAQFSRDQTDNLTSTDVRDKIAVFAGNQCRGVGYIQYNAANNLYEAYITSYSNTATGDRMVFRLWDADPGVEYQSADTVGFIPDALIGSVKQPFIAHAAGLYQTIPLASGWNWISFDVNTGDNAVNNMLASLTSTSGDEIKTLTDNAYSQYDSKLGWVGPLTNISLSSGYMIHVSHADTIHLFGSMTVKPVLVQLNKGWNWIGYPMPVNIDVNSYFANAGVNDGDELESQDQFSVYNAASNTWQGSLQFLSPGKGYRLNAKGNITVPEFTGADIDNPSAYLGSLKNPPAGTPSIINNTKTVVSSTVDPTLKVNAAGYAFSMTVTAAITQDGQPVTDPTRYEIRLYSDTSLLSVSALTKLANGQLVAFIPVYGNDNLNGKKLQVNIYDSATKKLYPVASRSPLSSGTGNGLAPQKQFSLVGTSHAVTAVPPSALKVAQDSIVGTVASPQLFALMGTAALDIVSSVDKMNAYVGDVIQYSYAIKNTGADAGLNVALTDTLNSAFSLTGTDPSVTPDASGKILMFSYPEIGVNQIEKITVSVKANQVGQFEIANNLLTADNDTLGVTSAPKLKVSILDKRANESKLFIPNLFTPNGDGINDRFVIVGLNDYYAANSLMIYDKNFRIVYQKDNYQNDWDGGRLPMGSYGYVLKVKNATGTEQVFKGYITINY